MKNKRKVLLIIGLIVVFSMTLVACGSDGDTDPAVDGDTDTSVDGDAGGEVAGLDEAFAEQPVLLTSVGQSADVEMVKSLMDNAEIEYEIDKLAKGEDLTDEKTLVLAVGGSSKGLGAAGIDADSELERTKELIEAAKEKDIKIIAMHIGGENRRGELSDKFIDPSASQADYIIVVEEGNEDGIFDDIASKNSIPMDVVDSIGKAIEPLEKAFK